MKYKLSDEVLACVAQCLQLAMLTGTDIVDHLRLLEVQPSSDAADADLVLTSEARDRHKRNIDDLLERARTLSTQAADPVGTTEA